MAQGVLPCKRYVAVTARYGFAYVPPLIANLSCCRGSKATRFMHLTALIFALARQLRAQASQLVSIAMAGDSTRPFALPLTPPASATTGPVNLPPPATANPASITEVALPHCIDNASPPLPAQARLR